MSEVAFLRIYYLNDFFSLHVWLIGKELLQRQWRCLLFGMRYSPSGLLKNDTMSRKSLHLNEVKYCDLLNIDKALCFVGTNIRGCCRLCSYGCCRWTLEIYRKFAHVNLLAHHHTTVSFIFEISYLDSF